MSKAETVRDAGPGSITRFPLEQIKIVMDVNIPNETSHNIPFTRDSLYYPSGSESPTDILSQYPYFTYQVKYNKTVLARMSYAAIVSTFFNKNEFVRVFQDPDDHTPLPMGDNNVLKNEYISHNIHTMIELLFSTYPVPINHEESYSNYILNNNMSKISFKDAIPAFLQPVFQSISSENAYLKINANIYTVNKTIWLNDVLNHPVYRTDLIDEYKRFITWRTKQMVQNKKDMEQVMKDIIVRALQSRIVPTFESGFIAARKQTYDLDSMFKTWLNAKSGLSDENRARADEMKKHIVDLKRANDINTIAYLLDVIHHELTTVNIFLSEPDLTPIRDQIRTWYNSAFDASYRMGQYTKFIDRIAKSKTTISTSTTQTAIDRNTYIDRLLALIPSLYNNPIYVLLDPAGSRTMNGFIQIVDETNEVVGWLSKNGVSVPPELTQIVDQLYKLIKTYQLYQVIQGKYFGETIRIFADDDNKEMKSVFDTKHRIYLDYGNKLKQFIRPFRESSNQVFQVMINEYLSSSSVALEHYLKTVLEMMKENTIEPSWDQSVTEISGYQPDDPYVPLLVGITEYSDQGTNKPDGSLHFSRTDPGFIPQGHRSATSVPRPLVVLPVAGQTGGADNTKYEIYVMVDVIGGEVNSNIMSKIVCRYRGETLGDMYTRLFRKKYAHENDWELNTDRPRGFIDTTPWTTSTTATTTTTADESVPAAQPIPAVKTEGGRKHTIRHFKRTHKKNTRRPRKSRNEV